MTRGVADDGPGDGSFHCDARSFRRAHAVRRASDGRPGTHARSRTGITDRMKSFFGSAHRRRSREPERLRSAGAPQEIECPDVAVRQGASTLAISTAGTESSPMSTRYQVTIGQTARECAALGGVMTMKVGVQGRVLLGPAGGPGRVDVPLRFAVVEEGTNPKPIVSKLYRLAVDVPPGQTMVPFMHVDQD